jgi:hypothetical protein
VVRRSAVALTGPRGPAPRGRAAALAAAALLLAACAARAPVDPRWPALPVGPALAFGADTFAFENESRSRNAGKPDLYANYCFVMARAVLQFQRFARFDRAAPRLDAAGDEERVRRVVAHAPWRAPLPAAERVVIPGYGSLHELSRAETAAVKAGLGPRWWTLLHWTNWRVGLPVGGEHQEGVAREILAELRAGRPAQLLVTNLPAWELNHTVVAYGARVAPDGAIEFVVYDPNDARAPGVIAFDPAARRFAARSLHDTTPGAIRAFRMSHHPLL